MIRPDLFWYWNKIKMKLTYRGKNLPDYFSEGSGPPLKKRFCDFESPFQARLRTWNLERKRGQFQDS